MNRYSSPPDYASELGVSADKVVGFITRGELRAINVATNLSGCPRWRISSAAIAEFELRRSSSKPVPRRRRKETSDVREFIE